MICNVTVVIPAYKAPEKLKKCLDHLKGIVEDKNIIVIDNDEENNLFTKSINKVLKNNTTEFVLALNQDCYLDPMCIPEMLKFMNRNLDCGICAPLQLNAAKDYVTCGGVRECFPNGIHEHGKLVSFIGKNRQQQWLNGACLLIRMSMVKEIGVMDKNLQFIFSDSDYCFRARSAGWQCWVIGDALCVHEHGESSDPSKFIEKVMRKDFIAFSDKWITANLFRHLAREVF